MAANSETDAPRKPKAAVLGRSALTGRVVFAPVVTKKMSVSNQRIEAAVKSALANKK